MFSEFDKTMMLKALLLAEKGIFTTSPNPNVGCVIAKDQKILGEGYHFRQGEGHAEVYALREAGEQALGATAYVTLEPCSHQGKTPPCANALIEAGIERVVVATVDPNPLVAGQGIEWLEDAGIKVSVGLCKKKAQALNADFFKRMQTGLPFVQLKLASSLDGRTALANGESKWITGSEARSDVQAFRAKACAILSTAASVIADEASLNVRFDELPQELQKSIKQPDLRQPLRVILDSKGRLDAKAKLFSLAGEILIFTSNSNFALNLPHVEVQYLPEVQGKLPVDKIMLILGKRGINRLWVEAGATLARSLFSQNLVDELVVYQAPKLMGADAKPLIDISGISSMDAVLNFEFSQIKQIGSDIRVILQPI